MIWFGFLQVLAQQGLGKYCDDPEFVRYTSKEMQEALEMTPEEMDRAAHRLLVQEQAGSPISFPVRRLDRSKNQFDYSSDPES